MNYFITVTDKGPTGVYLSRDLAERVKETRLGEVRHEVVECVPVDDISTGTCSRCGNTDTPVQRFCRGCIETSGWLSPDEAKRLEAQCAEEKKQHEIDNKGNEEWIESLCQQLCKMEDILGFKNDAYDKEGKWVPTIGPWVERVRDLLATEGELGDVKEQCARFANSIQGLEAQCATLRNTVEVIGSQNHNLECPNCRVCEEVDKALKTDAGTDLLARLEMYERALALATPILTEVSKACCDMLDWDQIDADQVNAALNACNETLKGQP